MVRYYDFSGAFRGDKPTTNQPVAEPLAYEEGLMSV